MNRLNDNEIIADNAKMNFYELTFKNQGGLVMPIVLKWTYDDNTTETETIPAEIWRYTESKVRKVFKKEKRAIKVEIDPEKKTADVDTDNNVFPRVNRGSRFDSRNKD